MSEINKCKPNIATGTVHTHTHTRLVAVKGVEGVLRRRGEKKHYSSERDGGALGTKGCLTSRGD